MLNVLYSRAIVMAASVAVVILNVAHPFLHAFEGGWLDSCLVYMNVWTGFALNQGVNDV